MRSGEAEPEVGGQRKWSQRMEIQRTKVKVRWSQRMEVNGGKTMDDVWEGFGGRERRSREMEPEDGDQAQ